MSRPPSDEREQPTTPGNGHEPDDLGELRSLLVGPEEEEIRQIKERLDNPRRFAREVGKVIGPALRHGAEHGFDIGKELGPPVEEAVRKFIRDDPGTVADAIFPVIGPAIRKSIAASLRGLVQSVNRSLEHSFTLKGLRWRLEARRTGRSFAEVVLLHSLIYRVEQVFLIHRETGLLLEHVVAESVEAPDADVVSGMLTAIQDFARDSFRGRGEQGLDSLRLGDLTVLLEHGPNAVLAAVVRGQPPFDLREDLATAIEDIHREHGYYLDRFEGDATPFTATRPRLEECLAAQYDESDGEWRGIPRWLWASVAVGCVLLAVFGWRGVQARWRWQRYVEALNDRPGIVVTEAVRTSAQGGAVRGLRDPLVDELSGVASAAGLDQERIHMEWQPFQSLHPRLALRRAEEILAPPSTVALTLNDGRLSGTGTASRAWLQRTNALAVALPGVREVDLDGVSDQSEADFRRALGEIDGARLRFATASSEPPERIEELAAKLSRLSDAAAALAVDVELSLIGRTDDTGPPDKNKELSLERAQAVRQQLLAAGVSVPVQVEGRGSEDPIGASAADPRNRSVTFSVRARTRQ